MAETQDSGRRRVRRGWNAMSEAEKQAWKESKNAEAAELTHMVARAVIDLIEHRQTERNLGWKEAWVPPQNIIYGRRYTGVNALTLTMQARQRGQKDCRFLTLRSLSRLRDADGGKPVLKEGARPYLIMSPRRGPDRRLSPGEDMSAYEPDRLEVRADGLWLKGRLFFSTVRVYSVADTTAAVPPLAVLEKTSFQENEFFETVFEACGLRLTHIPGSGAFYSKADGTIHLPPRETFDSPATYYCTVLHEFYHWTGAPERENRLSRAIFGDEEYAREELRAELFAAVTSVMFGLKGTLPQSAGYIERWNKMLRDNSKDIISMASQVQNMASALYDLADGCPPQLWWMRDMDFSSVPTPVLDARIKGMDLEAQWRRDMGLDVPGDEEAEGNAGLHMRSRAYP